MDVNGTMPPDPTPRSGAMDSRINISPGPPESKFPGAGGVRPRAANRSQDGPPRVGDGRGRRRVGTERRRTVTGSTGPEGREQDEGGPEEDLQVLAE